MTRRVGVRERVREMGRQGERRGVKEYGLQSSTKYRANGVDPLDGCLMKDA
ncbi:hypothetical protein WN55_07472 [Dufourea novaeangliae]|uniref:Uncharacterized protein n=1 Tax=Dufourea novaeangliae TaxID=178035 RepID=A0A154PS77_DUFNO|nr:hypothetical protein WN55_07472 [Dufourea novaeangliae]